MAVSILLLSGVRKRKEREKKMCLDYQKVEQKNNSLYNQHQCRT